MTRSRVLMRRGEVPSQGLCLLLLSFYHVEEGESFLLKDSFEMGALVGKSESALLAGP